MTHAARDGGGGYRSFSSPAGGKGPGTYTVAEALEHIGIHAPYVRILFVLGLGVIGDAMEVVLVSLLGRHVACLWRLSPAEETALTAAVFVAFIFSPPVLGKMGDKFGRRNMIIFTCTFAAYFGLLSSLAPTFIWLLVLRTLTGLYLGGVMNVVVYAAELLPTTNRGFYMGIALFFWAFGGIFEVCLAIATLNTLGWRWMVALTSLPMFAFLCFTGLLPPSPRFLLKQGRHDEAVKVLHDLWKSANKEPLSGELVLEDEPEPGNVRDLFRHGRGRLTGLLLALGVNVYIVYYGVVILSTQVLSHDMDCDNGGFGAISDLDQDVCPLECGPSQTQLIQIMWTTAAEVPGVCVLLLLLDRIGRRGCLQVALAVPMVAGITGLLLGCSLGKVGTIALLCVARAVMVTAAFVLQVFNAEVFPTELRSVAYGLVQSACRVGGALASPVAVGVAHHSLGAAVAVFVFCSIVGLIIACLLPVEPMGKTLEEIQRETKKR